jgi:hypothetical protein
MNAPDEAPQSTFVTVLAWLIIVLNAFAALVGVMQNVMVNFLMPTMIINSPIARSEVHSFTLFRVFALSLLVFVVFMTYCGYAFLKRRNWPRRVLVVVCGLVIAWGAVSLLLFALGVGPGSFPTSGPTGVPPDMRHVFRAMIIMTSIITVGMCILLGWIITRLRSPDVVAEFGLQRAIA